MPVDSFGIETCPRRCYINFCGSFNPGNFLYAGVFSRVAAAPADAKVECTTIL